MAYSTIDKSETNFNTKLYTGNGSTQSITGVGFQPDWTWVKARAASGTGNDNHSLCDSVRAKGSYGYPSIYTNLTSAEYNPASGNEVITDFISDGFALGGNENSNYNSNTYVSWNWLAGGTAPSQTYVVKVVSDSGNKYRFDDFGTSAVTLDLQEGGTYTFDQSDSSNSGHPLRFSTTSNGSHGGGSEYTTGVTTNGTPGSSGAYTRITVAASAPTLYYYCTNHSGMGGQANTNSSHGSSNFSGSIQSTVSANITAGFSIVKYTGTGSTATFGHGLGAVPKMIIIKRTSDTEHWQVYHSSLGNTKVIELSTNAASFTDANRWNNTTPTSSLFTLGNHASVNSSGDGYIAYCFAEKTGYSKFGSYIGNGNADGTFVYTGFKPAWIMYKDTSGTSDWYIQDIKRRTFNVNNVRLEANNSDSEVTGASDSIDILSNGFKFRHSSGSFNISGNSYIYMAFGQTIVGSNNIPATAR